MNVASLPKKILMITVINETVLSCARSRANQLLTDAPLENLDKEQAAFQTSTWTKTFLGSQHITQAPTLQQSLAMVSGLWKQKRPMVVHQKIPESWAINVIYNAAGLQVGDTPNSHQQIKIKQAALDLMPVLRTCKMRLAQPYSGLSIIEILGRGLLQRCSFYCRIPPKCR